MSATPAARNNPSGISLPVIQANRLRIGDAEGVAVVILVPSGFVDITKPFQSPWRKQNEWQVAAERR